MLKLEDLIQDSPGHDSLTIKRFHVLTEKSKTKSANINKVFPVQCFTPYVTHAKIRIREIN